MGDETSEPKVLELTEREVKEIKHSLFYAYECNHGTSGHNQLILIAKMARHLGFMIRVSDQDAPDGTPWTDVELPDGVSVTK